MPYNKPETKGLSYFSKDYFFDFNEVIWLGSKTPLSTRAYMFSKIEFTPYKRQTFYIIYWIFFCFIYKIC